MSTGEHRLALPSGYELGKYRFKEILGSGGFGITYLAEDRMLSRQVAVKELLPNDIATRIDGTTVAAKTKGEEESLAWARERFVNEGRALAACDHPNVVHVYEMIEANGTAYMVTKYEEGRSLERWLKELGRTPTEEELRGIIAPLLSGLERVHSAGFLHRDIKPDNIYLTTNGRPVLLDFGSARQAISNRSMAMTSIVTSGYAPFEQYYEDGNQGPWSDIYALGAVMFRAITGKKPPEATRRLKDDPCERLAATRTGQYSTEFLKAVDRALSVNESKRPQSVAEWRVMLGEEADEPATMSHHEHHSHQVSHGNGKSGGGDPLKALLRERPWLAPVSGGVVVALTALIWWLSTRPTPVPDLDKNKDNKNGGHLADFSPTASPAPSAPLYSIRKKTDDNGVNPSPTAAPDESPTPGPMPTAAPTEAPVVASPTPLAPVAAAQVDPQLVGSWQVGSTKSKRERWDIGADGRWVASGTMSDTGTLVTAEGRITETSDSTQQQTDTAYQFQDGVLVTNSSQTGITLWHRVNQGTASSSSTPHHHSSSGNNNGQQDGPGRQIFNRFLQNHGF